ncbi:hypothetical protein [Pseudomonas sp. O230]|uniref:hypothetical protein n=1 Tax=Pseudomonas sp. O230 TaxID=3159450 RepID=UPI00387B9036
MAKDLKDNVTIDMFNVLYPKLKPGRKALFGEPMSAAQRSRKYRAEKRNQSIIIMNKATQGGYCVLTLNLAMGFSPRPLKSSICGDSPLPISSP